jgi:hypothetical protein
MVDGRKRSRVIKKKVNKRGEKKFKKLYATFITNIKKYRGWHYVKKYNFEKFKQNIFELLDSEYITYAKGKKLLNISIKFYRLYLNILNEILMDFYIEIFDKLYIKFNKICEDSITKILTLNSNRNKFYDHILKMNIKINNPKYKNKLRYLNYDYFDIIENITYYDIIESDYININISQIKNILERLFEKPDYNLFICKFIDYNIELMSKNFGIVYGGGEDGEGGDFDSLNKYIMENYKLNSEYKIKIILLNFIHYINSKYNKLFDKFDDFYYSDNSDDFDDFDDFYDFDNSDPIEILKKFTVHTIEFDKIENLVKDLIKNKEITLDILYKIDLNLIDFFYKNRQDLKSKDKPLNMNIYNITTQKEIIYLWLWYRKYDNITYIDKCMNVFRNQFIKLFINNIKPEKDIINIIENKLFDFRDTFLTLDEKVELFKKSYSGKVKSYDLDKFIISSNELSSFLIKNISIKEEHVKYTLFTGNYKLLEIIADMKFNFKIEHFRYIISDNNIIELIKIINKYNTFDFSENIEWYKYIEHLLTNIDIHNILYNDDNKDLQIKLKDKIQKYKDSKLDMTILNEIDLNDFCKHIIENNIKLEIKDILKIKDDNKRLFLFRNISN